MECEVCRKARPTESIQCSNWQSTTAMNCFYDEVKVKNEGKPVLGTLATLSRVCVRWIHVRCEIRLVSDSRVLTLKHCVKVNNMRRRSGGGWRQLRHYIQASYIMRSAGWISAITNLDIALPLCKSADLTHTTSFRSKVLLPTLLHVHRNSSFFLA